MNPSELKNLIRTSLTKLRTEQIADGLLSAYFIKSIVRGDFIPGKSDIDILLIFKNDLSHEKQSELAEKLSFLVKDNLKDKHNLLGHYGDCDILYICESEIPKTEIDFLDSPFSIFTAFGFDLKANNELISGDNLLSEFVAPDPLLFTDYQVKRLLEKSLKGDLDVVLASGQVVRLLLIKLGLRSLHKQEIRDFIEDNSKIESWVRDFAIKHLRYCYEEKNNRLNFENECREFLAAVQNCIK